MNKSKHKLILFLLLISQNHYFSFAEDLLTKYSHFDFYTDNKNTKACELTIPFFTLKVSSQENNSNFGITATSAKIKKEIPFTIKTGNLSLGGILSKMNNPSIASPSSPFSSGFSLPSAISATLPGYTSFSKPFSTFFDAEYINPKNRINKIVINTMYTPQDTSSAFSFLLNSRLLNNKLSISIASCAGIFPYEENKISSWFSNELYYHEGHHLCSFNQFSISYSNILSIFSAGFYESPFGKFSTVYRLDNKFSSKRFTFLVSGFYNPNTDKNTVITSSDKTLSDCFQLRTGLEYKFITGFKRPVFIKTGIQAYGNINFSQKEYPLKITAGIQINSSLSSFTITTSISGTDDVSDSKVQKIIFNSANIQIKNSWTFSEIIPAITLYAGINPNDDFSTITKTYKATVSINHSKNPKLNSSGTFSITQKNDEISSKKLSGSISSKFTWKKINMIIKLSGSIDM